MRCTAKDERGGERGEGRGEDGETGREKLDGATKSK